MERIRYVYCGLALCFVFGCQSMPPSTKDGRVVEVPILSTEAIGDAAANPGDEVRWVNKRAASVRVVLIDPVGDEQLTCKHRFGGFRGRQDTATLPRSETASLCFRSPGTYRYVVRMESTRETGEISVPGVIRVGEPGAQAG
jgi:hypothetical protein